MSKEKIQFSDSSVGKVVKDIAIGARDLWFDYRASQIGHSVANGMPTVRDRFCVAETLRTGDESRRLLHASA